MYDFNSGLRFEESGLLATSPIKYFVRTFPTDKIVRLHYHRSLEINICRGIDGHIKFGGGECRLSPDTLVLLPPDTPHSYSLRASEGTLEVYHFLISAMPGVEAALDSVLKIMLLPLSECSEIVFPLLEQLRCFEPSTLLKTSGGLLMLAGELTDKSNTDASDKVFEADGFLRKVIDFTENNYSMNISLDDVSSHSGISKYHFCRKFREKTGETWSEYLRGVRLTNSLRLLSEGWSVAHTAGECGFESDSYYIKCFKNAYSATPFQWVNALK